MLSKRIAEIPANGGWIFEPKWDGLRALVFRDGNEILIQSRDEKSLNRYFPELAESIDREQFFPNWNSLHRLAQLRPTVEPL